MALVPVTSLGAGYPLNLTGATSATRYVGGTAAAAPVAGTFAVGDVCVTQTGHVFVCTVAGTPGTWVDAGNVGGAVSSVFGRTGAVVAAASDYTYAQIANSANAIAVSNLAAGSAGQVIQGATPSYAYPPGYQYTYDEDTAGASITHTTEATADAFVTASAHTYDGATAIKVAIQAPIVKLPSPTGGQLVICLYDGASSIGKMWFGQNDITGGQTIVGAYMERHLTPSNGSHTYSGRAYVTSTTGTPAIQAGAGGNGNIMPIFIRAVQV